MHVLCERKQITFVLGGEGLVVAVAMVTAATIIREFLRFSLETSQSSEFCIIDYASWLYDKSYRSLYEKKLDLLLGEPTSTSSSHGQGSGFSSNLNQTDLHSFIQRFKQFENTYPYTFIVEQLQNEIKLYYKEIASKELPFEQINGYK